MDRMIAPPRKDIRLVNLPIKDAAEALEDYLNKSGWKFSKTESADGSFRYEARNPKASTIMLFFNNTPQISLWTLYPDQRGTRIAMYFKLFDSSLVWFYGLLIGILITVEYSAVRYFTDKSASISSFAPFMLSIGPWIVFTSCISYIKRYQIFRNGFYSLISDTYGIKEENLREGFYFPELCKYGVITGIFVIPILLIIIAKSFSGFFGLNSSPAFFFRMLLFLTPILLFLGAFIFYKPRFNKRLKLSFFGMQAGALIAIYLLFPIFHAIVSPLIGGLGIGLIAVLIGLFVILCIMVFMAIDIFAAAEELEANLYQYKTDNADSEISASFKEDWYSKAFYGLVLIIWITLALINLAGVYLSLSFVEYLFADKNFLFPNPWQQSFFGSKDIADKLFWGGLFSLPIILFLAIFVYKRTSETMRLMILKEKNPIPEDLRERIEKICRYSGVRMPTIFINEEDEIIANVKLVFLLGSILKISRKALNELTTEELEALLAHEIFHLKRHNLTFTILNTLSQWTLFGSGFLTVIQNSKEIEYEADRFSVKWLAKNGLDKGVLIGLLDKVALLNSLAGIAFSDSAMSFSAYFKKKDHKRMDGMYLQRFIDELFFGDIVISYVHPTTNERIKRIEQLA